MKKIKHLGLILLLGCMVQSCEKKLIVIENNMELLLELADYGIFTGNAADLIPSQQFHLYELSTELFTDYAEKQRLIRIPQGQSITATGDGLPVFPDGTLLVKTFFYYNDARDTSKGKKIIETRVLIKSGSSWNVGNYIWNDQQTKASLSQTSKTTLINWIDRTGKGHVISYHIPGKNECTTCHQQGGATLPIGPKIRNLNREVIRNGNTVNQLQHLIQQNLMKQAHPSSFNALPDWQDTRNTIEERARAYLDVNCAHCHHPKGFASDEKLYLSYELSLEESRIAHRRKSIVSEFAKGTMPKMGTTVVDQEALTLLKSYMDSLK